MDVQEMHDAYEDNEPLEQYDEQDRQIIWKRKRLRMSLIKPKKCCSVPTEKENRTSDKNFILKLTDYNTKLFDNCETKSRSIKNWQRLRLMLMLHSFTGGRKIDAIENLEKEKEKKEDEKEKEKKPPLVWYESLAFYIIDPVHRYKLMWDSAIGLLFLSAFVLDPVIYAFHNVHLENETINQYMTAISIIFVIDICLVPFTGIDKNKNE